MQPTMPMNQTEMIRNHCFRQNNRHCGVTKIIQEPYKTSKSNSTTFRNIIFYIPTPFIPRQYVTGLNG